jgi:conjugative transfer signal peptidase TraF
MASGSAGLSPDSGGRLQGMHNHCVGRWEGRFVLHRRWPLALLAGSGAIAFVSQVLELRINTTASMPVGLYLTQPRRLARGAWTIFCLPGEKAQLGRDRAYLRRGSCPDGSQELLKEVAAVPGDTVALTPTGLLVNGRLIPGSKPRAADRGGRALPHPPFGERVVPPGELWVLGCDPCASWDSRYFGPVPLDHVRATAIPILTFGPDLGGCAAAGNPL